jgi:oxygen-independent coproporphyrinogen-3 oxidase
VSTSRLPFRHLYLHIPFCRHKCGYCDFNAYAGMDTLMPAYVDALLRELEAARREHSFGRLATIYLGGGTPSLLPAGLSVRLLEGIGALFQMEDGAEVTLEANPASTDAEKLAAWRELGVNRLSLGVQGFDRRALAVLERRTDGAQAVRAYEAARAAGFDNISLDLIYGVPFQSLEAWLDTLGRALALEPDHLSCYCLTFEPGTLLQRRLDRGVLPPVESDFQWRLLEAADQELERAGYARYEVSSWARPGRESRHNQAYWLCRPVYGAGAGAHSYASDGDTAWRWWNVSRPRTYIDLAPAVREDGEELEPHRARAESLMLGLRRPAGIAAPAGFDAELEGLAQRGLVELESGWVRPTRRGLDLHNQVALAVL